MDDLIAILMVVFGARADGCRVLDGLDLQRQVAYESADPAALAAVYAPGPQRAAELRMLASWTDRGIALSGGRMQRRSCSGDASRLRVVERLGPVWAVLDGTRRRLPTDGWDARVIELSRLEGRWVIARVSPG